MTRRFIFDVDDDDGFSLHDLLVVCLSRVVESKLDLEESTPTAVAEAIKNMGEEEAQKLMLKVSELVVKGTTPKDESGFVIDFSLEI